MYELHFYIYHSLYTLKSLVRISSWEGDAMKWLHFGMLILYWWHIEVTHVFFLFIILTAEILTTGELFPTKLELIHLPVFLKNELKFKRLVLLKDKKVA